MAHVFVEGGGDSGHEGDDKERMVILMLFR